LNPQGVETLARVETLRLGLTQDEVAAVRTRLAREPTEVEWSIIDAEWSEHCSYKSSKALLKQFPVTGKRVLVGPGYDAGVLDIGAGLIATVHIESHNHPSAIDPYGGAATGIGGVLRDILSMGSRPIALVDILRFGMIGRSSHSRWLMRNVVRGIADYGNCAGIPTVAGEVEFDDSFERNCLVDVACVGIGEKEQLVLGQARVAGDLLVLIGGSTGRDGIRGATFASKNLAEDSESERSSVQVPDPFMKKLILDALLEIIERKLARGMKDLGGGGLSSALSELGSKGGNGLDVELSKVNLREPDMTATEIMISESQERMMLVLPPRNTEHVFRILKKYDVPYSIIGEVRDHGNLRVKLNQRVVADLPIDLVVNAPLMPWATKKPAYMTKAPTHLPVAPRNLARVLLSLLSSPDIASKRWVYEQYDHEVGVRTVTKPGQGDAAALRLPNGNFLAIKADGNSKATYLNPRSGAAGTVSEACRNVVAVGAEPIAMVDHLQVGDPADPGVYWAFSEMVKGMADYCRGIELPVVGGKVSFYNEDQSTKRAIKPSPVVLVVGLIDGMDLPMSPDLKRDGEKIVLVGETLRELGGSEYYEYIHEFTGGVTPGVNPARDRELFRSIPRLMRNGWITAAHDCSSGGIAVAISEMCMGGAIGATIEADKIPAEEMNLDEVLLAESHGRFILTTPSNHAAKLVREFSRAKIPHYIIGRVGGTELSIRFRSRAMIRIGVDAARATWAGSLPRIMRD
jgi:phosphoribosylformylglycinamidine synthase